MNSIITSIKERARSKKARVILPECGDPRVLEAAALLVNQELASVLLVGDIKQMQQSIAEHNLALDLNSDEVLIQSPQNDDLRKKATRLLLNRRSHKGMTWDEANEIMNKPLWFGVALLELGYADGCVAGSIATTADVIRAGIYCCGLADDVETVSSIFLMAFEDGKTFTYADCGVVPYPDSSQLADITLSAAQSHEKLTEQQSRVAMLSFSTKGSANHPRVELVREAMDIAKSRDSDLEIDGELQFDAAFDPEVAKRKAPDSKVAGLTNVFIFPNLDAGNIAYKITERLAGAQATGPILQGLGKPLMDLSRGCTPEDIVVAACVSIIMKS